MKFLNRSMYSVLAVILMVMVIFSCEEDPTTIGEGVIGGEPFITDKAVFDVFAFNKKIEAVETNQLPTYQLGVYDDPVYGETEARITSQVTFARNSQGAVLSNPTFGSKSEEREQEDNTDENETIIESDTPNMEKGVLLYIPYLQNNRADSDGDGVIDKEEPDAADDPNNDSDGDGRTNNQERLAGTDPLNEDTDGDGINDGDDDDTLINRFPIKRDLDSIYGPRDMPFNLTVEESTFFLRDRDPNTNFQEAQEYFSSQDFSSFTDAELFNGEVIINDEQIVILPEDDPDTEEDESLGAAERLEPGIRVRLDAGFFQENILDMEGKPELLSDANFKEFFRGIHLSINSSEDIMLLLDLTQATITIDYEYDTQENGDTVKEESSYTLRLLTGGGPSQTGGRLPVQGNAVNTLINDNFPPEILNNLDTEENASRIYLKGGPGSFAEIEIFERDNGRDIINQIKSNNWIINEANLVFYVDRNTMDAQGGINNNGIDNEPPRLYLYNAETHRELYRLEFDNDPDLLLRINSNYDGSLQKENEKGIKYTVKITNYINDIVVRDSTNATLGLTISPDIRLNGFSDAMLEEGTEDRLPAASTISPLGTVLFGSDVSPDEENRKLKLEIFYTRAN